MVVFPFRFQVAAGAPPPVAQEEILAFCAAEKLRCLDLLPALHETGARAFVDYDHLSPSGSRLAAEALLRSGLLPSGPSDGDVLGRATPLAALRDPDARLPA